MRITSPTACYRRYKDGVARHNVPNTLDNKNNDEKEDKGASDGYSNTLHRYNGSEVRRSIAKLELSPYIESSLMHLQHQCLSLLHGLAMRGHGTSNLDGQVVATLCGVVERVNKLVYVRALRSRYKPEVGDIIVERVTEVAPKRWRLEINFSQDAVLNLLMLSSMNLPDGIQRRRTAID